MTGVVNAVAVVVAITLSLTAVASFAGASRAQAPPVVPGGGHHRVACLLAHLDTACLELAAPERLIAVSAFDHGAASHRLGDRPRLSGLDALEAIIDLRPDAVLVSPFDAADARAERLREAGIAVIDCGEARGVVTLIPAIHRLGEVFAVPDRAQALARAWRRRFALVAARVPAIGRRGGIYLAVYGDRLFGGTVGTSYHDVLTAAGVPDLAATRWRDWPEYTVEDLIALDPPLIVTKRGMGDVLRRLPGMAGVAACTAADGIVELDSALLDDAGIGMLDAAETLCDAVHPAGR
ncbi:MAG TPA: ABC transporter substrate-binding protein [Planctomycetota bacterium]|nr:ABC transporter substrate-binding protein [Planctomycetota bacterium]